MGSQFSKVYTIVHYPSTVEMGWLGELVNSTGAIFSINIEPTDNTELIEKLDSRIRDASGLAKLSKDESIKQMREREIKEASDVISRMINHNEVVSYLTIYILITSEEEKTLNAKCKEIERTIRKHKLKMRGLTNFLLVDGFKAVAPFFTIQTDLSEKFKRNILTSTFTGGFLFNTNTFIDPKGYYLGINQKGGIIIFDMWQKDLERGNSNMVAIGGSGSGKSLAIKHLLYNELPQAKILVIDPQDEYSYMCENVNGKIIDCNGGKNGGILNPLQVRIDRENISNSLSLHFQFLHTFFQILFQSLTEIEFATLELLLEELYQKFNITKETDIAKLNNTDFPILEDLYHFIEGKNSNDEVYNKLLSLIRPITIGQNSSIWNGYTNIDITTRMTVFNTSKMQNFQIQYKRAQYYNIISYAWDFLSRNPDEKTILVCDECHMLVDPNLPQALEYVKNISKLARKYNASVIFITQSIEDFKNEKVRLYGQNLLVNSTYKLFFRCDGQDLKDIVEIFNLTKTEESLIYNAKRGECLMFAGIRKIYAILKIFENELEKIDPKFKKEYAYD